MTVYRNTDLTKWGTGKGARLTSVEGDTNLWDIVVRLLALEVDAGQIDYGYTVGSDLYFRTTNHHVIGPIALPTAKWNARGEWLPNTQYFVNDTVAQDGTAYLVMIDHTSAAYFDPYATVGINHIYGAILTNPGNVIPAGGTTGQMLAKLTDADYDTTWTDAPLGIPGGGDAGQVLAKHSSSDGDAEWVDKNLVPNGGTTGQVLKKNSDADGDYSWVDP